MDVDNRHKYFDDLNILEFLILSDQLVNYNVQEHIPSDVGTEELFLPSDEYEMQSTLDNLSSWTTQNLMQINETKTKYIIYSRLKDSFATRLSMNNVALERLSEIKILGVWIQEDLSWAKNTKQLCISAFSRISVLSKLKYAGICNADLISVYKMFIRCIPEYCSVTFHKSLTQDQSAKLETIQSTSLKIILAEE